MSDSTPQTSPHACVEYRHATGYPTAMPRILDPETRRRYTENQRIKEQARRQKARDDAMGNMSPYALEWMQGPGKEAVALDPDLKYAKPGRKPAPWQSRNVNPRKAETLPKAILHAAHAMVHGVDQMMFPDTNRIPPGTPLSWRQAAIAVGILPRTLEPWLTTKPFREAIEAELKRRRESEDPVNLALAIAVRDDPGDGSPAAKRARLRAAVFIRGDLTAPARKNDVYKHPVKRRTPGRIYHTRDDYRRPENGEVYKNLDPGRIIMDNE
jgi:hypothetical protein